MWSRSSPFPTDERLPTVTIDRFAIRYAPRQYRHFDIDLEGSFDSYMAKFSSKTRATLRKKMRRLEEHCGGKLRWIVARLNRNSRRSTATPFRYPRRPIKPGYLVQGFRLPTALNCGLRESEASGYLLFDDSKPVAYILCPVREDTLLYSFVGYDPAYGQWSPGTVLQCLALELLFGEGRFRAFDFTQGEGAHKELFANRAILCSDLYFFRRTPKYYLGQRHGGPPRSVESCSRRC